MARALVLLASGTEEMEAVIIVDVLRRGGIEVVLAGLDGADAVTCSRQVKLLPDCALSEIQGAFDAIILPGGGPGSEAFAASKEVQNLLRDFEAEGKIIAAICAAPIALAAAGVGKGLKLTSHPSVKARLMEHGIYSEDRVVQDRQLITSRGPGTAFEFALALVTVLAGQKKTSEITKPMILLGPSYDSD